MHLQEQIFLIVVFFFFLRWIFIVICLGVFHLFYQNIVTTLVNGTIIKVYKYVYKCNRVIG